MKKSILLSTEPRRPVIPETDWLSTGSALLNLAISGRTRGGIAKGQYLWYVGDSSSGKAQPLDSLVLTPNGWKKMRNIRVGELVSDPDGGSAEVTGVYPQGEKAVYRVTFADGTHVECCDEHLWTVATREDIQLGWWHTTSLADIRRLLKTHPNLKLQVPTTKPVEFSQQPTLPMNPYLLGILLGDGFLGGKANSDLRFTTADLEVVTYLRGVLPEKCRIRRSTLGLAIDYYVLGDGRVNPAKTTIKELHLAGCRSKDKFIPKQYLKASVSDRMELLRGLIDSDGYVARCGMVSFTSISRKLIRDFLSLTRSLGAVCSVRKKMGATYDYKGEKRVGRDSYTVVIHSMPSELGNPCRLPRKANRVRWSPAKNGRSKTKTIVGVEPAGKKECQCIAVGTRRRLYITNGYTVTHNTWFAMTLLAEASINQNFKDHRFIYDNTENGMLMDVAKYFGPRLAKRLEPPKGKPGKPIHSATVQEFYYNLDNAYRDGRPYIYVLDSMDALDTKDDEKKFLAEKAAHGTSKQVSGSYGTALAKANSQNIKRYVSRLTSNGSILIVVNQTRDNIKTGPFDFGPDQRPGAGGHALRFYAHVQLWTRIVGRLTRTVVGKKREFGKRVRISVEKNRISGWEGSIIVPFLRKHGIDDVGACVNYLLEEKHWKGSKDEKDSGDDKAPKKFKAPGFNHYGDVESLVRKIEEAGSQPQLYKLVESVWREIDEKTTIMRKSRYA